MDIFQLIADQLHLLSMLAFLFKLISTKNVSGISYKTQEIYLVVFLVRYTDIFEWKGLYLLLFKIAFILLTTCIIYLIRLRRPYCLSYDKQGDNFQHYLFYLLPLLLAFPNNTYDPYLKRYSLWLQAFAIIPQLLMLRKIRDPENITCIFLLCMGLYRFIYILHWASMYWRFQLIIWDRMLSGIVQTVMYLDFFYHYLKISKENREYLQVSS